MPLCHRSALARAGADHVWLGNMPCWTSPACRHGRRNTSLHRSVQSTFPLSHSDSDHTTSRRRNSRDRLRATLPASAPRSPQPSIGLCQRNCVSTRSSSSRWTSASSGQPYSNVRKFQFRCVLQHVFEFLETSRYIIAEIAMHFNRKRYMTRYTIS